MDEVDRIRWWVIISNMVVRENLIEKVNLCKVLKKMRV